MIVFEIKTTRNNYWDIDLRREIKEQVRVENEPVYGGNSIHSIVTRVNNWMQNRKRDTNGAIWMSYKLVLEGDKVVVNNVGLNGDVKRIVGIIRKESY